MGAYREPGVEITQVQEQVTVSAGIADLMSGIIGPAYKVVELDDFVYPWLEKAGVETYLETTISGIEEGVSLDVNSIYVEFVSRTNQVIPFYPNGTNTVTVTGNTIRFGVSDGDIEDFLTNLDPSVQPTADLQPYRPRISYRAQYNNKKQEVVIASSEDLRNSAGKAVTINPLGFAANLMYQNSGKQFSVFAISGVEDASFNEAKDFLEFSDTYAFSVLSQKNTEVLAGYITWAKNRSLPENGYPTKLYISPYTPWYKNGTTSSGTKQLEDIDGISPTNFMFSVDQLNSTAKQKTAQAIASVNSQILEARISSIHPDMGWNLEKRHVLQTNPTYVSNTSGVSGGKCVLAENIKLIDGTQYASGTIITSTIAANLADTAKYNNLYVTVYVPIPGYYYSVQRAAIVSSMNPSDPKTGYPLSGISKVPYSEGFFGKTFTNIIAGGGTEVIIQPSAGVLPSSRHHLTTNMSSTQTKEDNILHQIDVVTKNFKIALQSLTGRYKQEPKYFKLLRATLTAYADRFVQKFYCKKLEILEVKQSETELDKVLVTLRITPYYAANYIDVTIYY